MITGEPALPDRQQTRCEVATISRDHLDAERLDLEVAIGDERVRECHRLADRPLVPMRIVDRPRERAHRSRADVVEAEVAGATKVAAGVEIAGRPRHARQRPLRVAHRPRHAAAGGTDLLQAPAATVDGPASRPY